MSANTQSVGRPLLRVLILEDELLIGAMLSDWLEELQCEPIGPAATVQAALGIIADQALGGAILDVSLKGGDSYPAAEALQAKNVPFAFATGREPEDLNKRFAGVTLLLKPFDFDAVRALVVGWARR